MKKQPRPNPQSKTKTKPKNQTKNWFIILDPCDEKKMWRWVASNKSLISITSNNKQYHTVAGTDKIHQITNEEIRFIIGSIIEALDSGHRITGIAFPSISNLNAEKMPDFSKPMMTTHYEKIYKQMTPADLSPTSLDDCNAIGYNMANMTIGFTKN